MEKSTEFFIDIGKIRKNEGIENTSLSLSYQIYIPEDRLRASIPNLQIKMYRESQIEKSYINLNFTYIDTTIMLREILHILKQSKDIIGYSYTSNNEKSLFQISSDDANEYIDVSLTDKKRDKRMLMKCTKYEFDALLLTL